MRARAGLIAVSSLLLGLCVAGCGSDGAAVPSVVPNGSAPQTVDVTMRDFAYSVPDLDVGKGSLVEFRFTNHGKVPHDAFIGDQAAQDEHEAEMAGMPAGHVHDMGPMGVTVQPGETKVLEYAFDAAGAVQIACHQKGHYSAGMKMQIAVA
jgi:uncharacterized cupredoxin-like copper-binding protein